LPYPETMPTHTLVTEEEYLRTSYEPECEYRDGELVERNDGTLSHGDLQISLGAYFHRRRKKWNIHVYTEIRVRIREGAYLVPDLAVITGSKPTGQRFLSAPPLIWIEILSPEDRMIRVNRKVREVLESGVPYVWVIDPETLESEVHTPQGSTTLIDGVFRIAGTAIEVPLAALEED
jgi:Uma2 family endonuclease